MPSHEEWKNAGGLRLASPSSANISPNHLVSPPTADQSDAVAILRNARTEDVLTWLKFVRSLQAPGHGSLSAEEVQAILILQGCPDDSIRAWLEANSDDFEVLSRLNDHPLHHPGQELQYHINVPTCPSSGSAWTEAAVHSGSSSQYAPTAPLVPPAVASDGPQSVLSKWAFPDFTIQADYLFFCTICPANRPFKNLSEWKRHERGHEISYICMLGGPRKLTRLGLVCVVCGSPGPDEKHLEAHKVNPCAEQTPASFSCKRRDQMVTHLNKYHRVYDVHQGQAIANEWKATSGKRAWSCCFCIKLFTNHEDRLKHISMEHFKPHQKSNHRTATNVIKGLLLQPGVAAAWDCVLAKSYPWTLPNIHWVNGTIGDLQLMLEKGPSASQSPESLAEAALAAAQVNWDTSGPDGSTLPMASHSVVIQRPHHTSQLTPCPFAQSWDTSYSSTVPEAAPEPFEAHDTSGFWSEAHVADGPKADIDPLNSLRRLPRQASDNLEHAIDDVTGQTHMGQSEDLYKFSNY